MRRAAFLLLGSALIVLNAPARVSAQESYEPGLLIVTFYPRPAGNDAIDMCRNGDFGDRAEALQFARTLAPTLGFGPGTVNYDEAVSKNCVTLLPDRGFVLRGPRPHERTFRFDPAPLRDEAQTSFNLPILNVAVCVPSLPATISPPPDERVSGACDHPLDHEVDWYSDSHASGTIDPIEVRFRATPETMLFGILGDAAFWVFTIGSLFLLVRRQRRKEWRFFTRHRFWAWFLNVVLMLVLFLGAVAIGPYWSSWIQSLQLYVYIGVPGEIFLVTVPSLALCTFMIAAPINGVREARRGSAPISAVPGTPGVPAEQVTIPRLSSDPWRPRTIAYAVFGSVPFLAFIVLTNDVETPNGVHVAFLLLAAIYLLFDVLWRDLRRWTARARDETSRLTLLRSELDTLGVHVSHAFIAESLLVGDFWIPQPGRMSAALLQGRTVSVWKRVASQPPSVLAGMAIDSVGVPGDWITIPFLLFEATLGATHGRHLPDWVDPTALGIGLILALRIAFAVVRRKRLVRAAARSPRAASYLRGLLLRRWIAARRVVPKRTINNRFFARRIPAVQIWRAALKQAERFATQAGIPAQTWQPMVQEVMATDLG